MSLSEKDLIPNFPNKKAAIISVKLFVIALTNNFFRLTTTPGQLQNQPPLWIYPIVFIVLLFIALSYFGGISKSRQLTSGRFDNWSFRILHDPLPFYHFCAVASIVSSIFGLIKTNAFNTNIGSDELFPLSVGLAFYIAVRIANRKFIRETGLFDLSKSNL